MCDVESYCYLPLLEELAYMPKHKYSFAPEIFEHSKAIARHFGLYDNACLQTSVSQMRWDDDAAQWIISTDRGDRMCAHYVAMANGPLNRPKLPGIGGIDSYEGHTFHTSRWDYDYAGGNSDEDLVSDGWTDIFRNLTGIAAKTAARKAGRRLTGREKGELMELADFQKMNTVRSRASEIVDDSEISDALKPWYRQFCKRPCFHDEYLPTFNRPNVHLVDTDGRGVERITPRGVVVGGTEYEVDCIVFATGFEVGTTYTRRAGYDIIGRGGQTLSDKWADGVKTLHGLTSHGFPNGFFTAMYGAGPIKFFRILDEWRSTGRLEGIDLS